MEYEDLFNEEVEQKSDLAVNEMRLTENFEPDDWMKASEVATFFGVNPKTVSTWQKTGKLDRVGFFKTPGGHRRYRRADIEKLVEANGN